MHPGTRDATPRVTLNPKPHTPEALVSSSAQDPRVERLPCTHAGTYADDCICERVRQHKCYIVATCDRDLRRRLRKARASAPRRLCPHAYPASARPCVRGARTGGCWLRLAVGRCARVTQRGAWLGGSSAGWGLLAHVEHSGSCRQTGQRHQRPPRRSDAVRLHRALRCCDWIHERTRAAPEHIARGAVGTGETTQVAP